VLYQPNTVFGIVSPSNGGNVVLAVVDTGGQPSGVLSYSKGSVSYTAMRITSLAISGQTATIEGFSSNVPGHGEPRVVDGEGLALSAPQAGPIGRLRGMRPGRTV
jgi:hypothetical protein